VKTGLLGLDPMTIEEHGAVSEATALAMAAEAADRLQAHVVIAVTGSAGPDAQELPPGTMVIAVQTPEDARVRMLRMPGDRERVRTLTTTGALHLARLAITGAWWRTD
jgi:nicotinamide-nucleotide amidase